MRVAPRPIDDQSLCCPSQTAQPLLGAVNCLAPTTGTANRCSSPIAVSDGPISVRNPPPYTAAHSVEPSVSVSQRQEEISIFCASQGRPFPHGKRPKAHTLWPGRAFTAANRKHPQGVDPTFSK